MRSLGVNAHMKNLINLDSRGDVEIDIVTVKENIKLGSVQRTIGWVIIVNLKVG